MASPAPYAERRPVLAELAPGRLARDVVLVLGAIGLTALSAQVAVPLPFSPVPISGQTFAVLLSAAALGPARGAIGMALYVLLGLVGLPFYAQGASGPEAAFGATGGYLAGFVVAALVVGACARRGLDRSVAGTLLAFAIGNLTIYAFGVPWLAAVTGASPAKAIELGLLPFLIGDALKALLAAGLLPAAWRLTGRA